MSFVMFKVIEASVVVLQVYLGDVVHQVDLIMASFALVDLALVRHQSLGLVASLTFDEAVRVVH